MRPSLTDLIAHADQLADVFGEAIGTTGEAARQRYRAC